MQFLRSASETLPKQHCLPTPLAKRKILKTFQDYVLSLPLLKIWKLWNVHWFLKKLHEVVVCVKCSLWQTGKWCKNIMPSQACINCTNYAKPVFFFGYQRVHNVLLCLKARERKWLQKCPSYHRTLLLKLKAFKKGVMQIANEWTHTCICT